MADDRPRTPQHSERQAALAPPTAVHALDRPSSVICRLPSAIRHPPLRASASARSSAGGLPATLLSPDSLSPSTMSNTLCAAC